MSNIVKFSQAGLPAVSSLSTALRTLERDIPAAGSAIIKMDKTGHWVFGAQQTEVEDSSKWAVNPFSFTHGYIAWGDGEVLAEHVLPVTEPLPQLDAAPAGAKKGWEMQVGFSMKCLTGEDAGLEVRFNSTSVGGKRSVQGLGLAIATQVDVDQAKPVAIVRLGKDHYQHKSYGRIFTPVFEVLEWMSLDGPSEPVEAAEPTPTRRRRV
jgi:hypothetical protein